jgi:hypothetical protein
MQKETGMWEIEYDYILNWLNELGGKDGRP